MKDGRGSEMCARTEKEGLRMRSVNFHFLYLPRDASIIFNDVCFSNK